MSTALTEVVGMGIGRGLRLALVAALMLVATAALAPGAEAAMCFGRQPTIEGTEGNDVIRARSTSTSSRPCEETT
jgi:hypothetical protein